MPWRMFYPELPVVIYVAPFKKCVVYDFIGIEILFFLDRIRRRLYCLIVFFFVFFCGLMLLLCLSETILLGDFW